MSGSLRHKTIHGVGWSFIDNISSSGITFLVGLVLARLLTPEEYGIMAMIAIFIAVSNSIIDSGFSNALIRKINVERVDYNTVFYFNLVVSAVLYILLFMSAPAISVFFNEPQLIEVTRVIGWTIIINALAIIPRTQFVKDVDFKTQTKVSFISSIVSGIIGVGMAIAGLGVWSLVGQQLSRQLLNTVFLWIYSKWIPVWEFSMNSFKELFTFGSKLLLSGLLDTVYKNIYYIVIGRFYSSDPLGQSTRADQFNTIFSSQLTSVVQRVLYPLHAINLNMLQVKGRSDLFLKLEIIKKIIAILPITLGIFYGIEWMLLGSVITSFIAFFLNSHYSADLIGYPTKRQLMDVLPTFTVSFFVSTIMWMVSFIDISYFFLLPLQIFIGLALAFFIYERLHLPEYLEVKQMAFSLIKRN